MKIYLVQHGKNVSEEDDPSKPLSKEGREDVINMANFVSKKMKFKIATIFHSDKLRARQTAELFSERLEHIPMECSEDMGPLDDPMVWKNRLSEMVGDVMFVGHLPHLSKLASVLLVGVEKEIVSFQMGCVLCLERVDGNWAVDWMLVPSLVA